MPSEVQPLRRVVTISAFDKDAKALKKKHVDLKRMIPAITAIMNRDKNLLNGKYRDHALTGDWKGYRELHVDGDWLLVYRIEGDTLTLVLTRTGSHDDLFTSRADRKTIRSYSTASRTSLGL
ncbi:type II toxin-antitoxin system YafQ family toxin [Bifidobacterium callimiconis]|uniref:Addiction module toxin RelE n=1 Tax=Bifidobacterium callimiconis TaxID=2306973 RepID=A0A430F7T6_9BIFI|nr:type II toxin-antitoxin system YafQ family toxin [Bifidobacterium callimiconis]MBT1177537.1 type II toxin-antitoxin system YafQ family toxin [Bifidobacterium callimiconis]RSX48970.1 addiction module toxin RelE [Bifidobacterium callimiconis]